MSNKIDANDTEQDALRHRGRAARAQMSDEERRLASDKIASAVARSSWFARAQFIGCYLSTETEAGTWGIISRAWNMKKRVFAPVMEKKGRMHFLEVTPDTLLTANRFGLLEPVDGEETPARQLQIVLTPLVAFDANKNRVGMGGGYYDRSFAFLKNRRQLLQPKLIGIAFDCQQVEKIAANPWDIRLYSVITESSQASVGNCRRTKGCVDPSCVSTK